MTLALGRRQAIVGAAFGGGCLLDRPVPALAQTAAARPQPPQAPMLLPDTTTHLGAVRAVATSRDGALVATGGVDRSVRLWDGITGRLLRRWRPPLGSAQIGTVDALGFSQDGRTLFVTAVDWVEAPRGIVYAYDVKTATIQRVIASPTGAVWRYPCLATSSRGGYLALAAQHQGVLVFGYSPDLAVRLLYRDQLALSDSTTCLAFSPDGGTLVTASRAGVMRFFLVGDQVSEQKPLRYSLPGEAVSLAFSADGLQIAVGFADRRAVAVVNRGGGVTMLEPPAALGSPGNLASVAWSGGDDGAEWLFAGGTVQRPNGANLVFAWRAGAVGSPLWTEVSQDSIADMTRHEAGGVIFGSSDAAWGRVVTRRRGRSLGEVITPSERLDLREVTRRNWGVDASGNVVEFQGLQQGQPALRFDLAELRLDEFKARNPRPDLHRPRDVEQSDFPAGVLRRGERVLSSDAAPGGNQVAIGTDEALLLLDAAGRVVTRCPVATPVWAVAFPRSARVVVAAHGDGALRWYGLAADALLHELGGLFVHADRGRWVAWRNDGRFACSELGGETLIGLHENGRDSPGHPGELTSRWLTIDQAYRRLYDPEAVSHLLRFGPHWLPGNRTPTLDDATGGKLLSELRVLQVCATSELPEEVRRTHMIEALAGVPDQALPPENCQALQGAPSPVSGGEISVREITRAIRVRLDAGRATAPITVDTFVNGVNVGRALYAPNAPIEKVVPLSEERAQLEFRAYGEGDAFVRTPALIVTRAAPPPVASAGSTLHILAVGINRYGGSVTPLRFAVADATTFVQTIQRVAPSTYTNVAPPVVLTDEQATLIAVQDALVKLALRAKPDDAVMIYLCGHGVSTAGAYHFVTADVHDADAAMERGEGCLASGALVGRLSDIRAARTFLLLDTCFASAIDLQTGGRLGHESGRFVLAASGYEQEALDGHDGVNGVFACAMKEALTKVVPASGGILDALELGRYVRERVPELARTHNYKQDVGFKAAGDLVAFPVAQVR